MIFSCNEMPFTWRLWWLVGGSLHNIGIWPYMMIGDIPPNNWVNSGVSISKFPL